MNLLHLILVRLELGQYSNYVYGYQCFICFALWSSFPLPGFSGREASWLYIGV